MELRKAIQTEKDGKPIIVEKQLTKEEEDLFKQEIINELIRINKPYHNIAISMWPKRPAFDFLRSFTPTQLIEEYCAILAKVSSFSSTKRNWINLFMQHTISKLKF